MSDNTNYSNVFMTIEKAMDSDPIGASVLINEVVYSFLNDEVAKFAPEIEALTDSFVLERSAIAKKALAKSYVQSMVEGDIPSESLQKNAEWIRGIESFVIHKADDTFYRDYGSRRVEVKARRDSRGRFSRGIKQDIKANVLLTSEKKLSPTIKESNATYLDVKGMRLFNPGLEDADKEQLMRHQAQWRSANAVTSEILSNFGSDRKKVDVLLNLQTPSGETYQKIVPESARSGTRLGDDAGWDYSHSLFSVEVAAAPGVKFDDAVSNKVAAYNSLGTVGGETLAQLATIDPERLNALKTSINRSDSRKKTGFTRLFDRIAAGGAVLEQVTPFEQFGSWAKFVGVMGPEAQEVLGPYVQQAAYRYRGTEREPDAAIIADFQGKTMRAVEMAADSRDPRSKISEAISNAGLEGAQRVNSNDLVMQAAAYEIGNLSRTRGGTYTPDELLLNVRADVAARHLLNTLPTDPFVADVSRKAGQILPSQGVLIDADGDVVSQAVGFTDDHYLPFNLKNLRSLYGGQYVRTRQQGGLTSEDIYASIRSNARMATVVSSSGVFSLEFDPNFRGARASSDKAKQMYDRYIKILDAVDSSGLYVQDISPVEREKVTNQVRGIVGNDNSPEFRSLLKQALAQKRSESKTISEDRLGEIEREAALQVQSEGRTYTSDRLNRRISDVFDEMVSEERNRMVSELRLNSKGYEVALQTLQQQFPYFIRNVKYQPLTSKNQGQGFLQNINQPGAAGARQKLNSTDRGYVQPGGLRATTLQSGTYEYAPDVMPSKPGGLVSVPETTTATAATGGTSDTSTATASTATARTALAPTGGLSSRIAAKAKLKSAEASKEFKDLGYSLLKLPTARIETALPVGTKWDEVKDNDGMAFRLLIDAVSVSEASKAFASDPNRVVSLLNNKDLQRSEIPALYDNAELSGTGLFAGVEEFTKFVSDSAEKLKSLVDFSDPFIAPLSGEAGLFYVGDKPQLFPEINALTSSDSLNALASSNPRIFNYAVILSGAVDTNQKFKDIIDTLQDIPNGINTLQAEMASGARKISPINLDSLSESMGVDRDELEQAFGGEGGASVSSGIVNSLANDAQRAYSLITAGKFIKELEAGGVEAPKVVKSLEQGRLSQQVRIISKSDPISLQVQRRRLLNLPLL